MTTPHGPNRMPAPVHRGTRSFSRAELEKATNHHQVRAAIADGELLLVLPGRYAAAIHAFSLSVRAHAATTATSGILTGRAALFVHGGLDTPPPVLDVAAPPGHRAPASVWLAVRRTEVPLDHVMRGAVRVAAAPLATVHAWITAPPQRRVGTVLAVLQRRTVTPEELRACIPAIPRIPDRAGLLKAIDAFDQGAHSFLEYEGLTKVFRGKEWARLVRQHHVVVAGKHRYLDTFDPRTATDIEIDGDRYHVAGERREADNERDAELAGIGIQTVRLSHSLVTRRPERCRELVRQVLRAREPQRTQSTRPRPA